MATGPETYGVATKLVGKPVLGLSEYTFSTPGTGDGAVKGSENQHCPSKVAPLRRAVLAQAREESEGFTHGMYIALEIAVVPSASEVLMEAI
jgi:hypothetical protein